MSEDGGSTSEPVRPRPFVMPTSESIQKEISSWEITTPHLDANTKEVKVGTDESANSYQKMEIAAKISKISSTLYRYGNREVPQELREQFFKSAVAKIEELMPGSKGQIESFIEEKKEPHMQEYLKFLEKPEESSALTQNN